ncbi:hypothetical protein O3M35_003600 [Rhynocoris fuscipes]|uniref:Uncharacterized protein n=1 Tax=Rhynocoris fuscipes TaxID=488301 RepID=A0AAW1CN01_9HEMI
MKMINLTATIIIVLLMTGEINGGLEAAGVCHFGCAKLVTACFSAAGYVFGTVPLTEISSNPVLIACNTVFAACETASLAALANPVL